MESHAMSAVLFDTLRNITTGTITTILLKKGIRRCWMNGPMPLAGEGRRIVGPAFTMRFIPVREDLATPESWAKPISTRGAIEEMPEGCIAVADAMGVDSAGIFGDILTMRMMRRGVAALVTDGVVRDRAGVLVSKLPVWCAGVAAPASVNGLTFVGWQEPIGCGGCAIFPGDVIVCDDDGAVVIPQDLVEFVAREGEEHERMETFIVSEVERGVKLPGLYPMNDETKARYEAWKKRR
jgi:regulator of RNase E activity RraA